VPIGEKRAGGPLSASDFSAESRESVTSCTGLYVADPQSVSRCVAKRGETVVEIAANGTETSSLKLLDEVLGVGGFCTVYKANWQGAPVALKINFHPKANLVKEANILEQLRHPCICTLYRVISVQERPALILEFMEGGNLNSFLGIPATTTATSSSLRLPRWSAALNQTTCCCSRSRWTLRAASASYTSLASFIVRHSSFIMRHASCIMHHSLFIIHHRDARVWHHSL
jgi:hypothetical protein